MEKIRVDKWLHAVRIFKTRTPATEACDSGKVKINDATVKPARLISIGEKVTVRKGTINITLKVLKLIDKRVSATEAAKCYEDFTPTEEREKMKLPAAFHAFASRERGAGRPTKKDRRDIDQLNEAWWEEE